MHLDFPRRASRGPQPRHPRRRRCNAGCPWRSRTGSPGTGRCSVSAASASGISAQSVIGWPMLTEVRPPPAFARLQHAAIRPDRQLGTPAHLHLVARDAARGRCRRPPRATRRHCRRSGADRPPEFRFDHRKLVETDAPVPVRHGTPQGAGVTARAETRASITYEIVAQPVHLHEGQAGMACDVRHGRAYTRAARPLQSAPGFSLDAPCPACVGSPPERARSSVVEQLTFNQLVEGFESFRAHHLSALTTASHRPRAG